MPTAETMDSEEDEKESIELQVWEHLQDQDLISFVCMIISSEQRKEKFAPRKKLNNKMYNPFF